MEFAFNIVLNISEGGGLFDDFPKFSEVISF